MNRSIFGASFRKNLGFCYVWEGWRTCWIREFAATVEPIAFVLPGAEEHMDAVKLIWSPKVQTMDTNCLNPKRAGVAIYGKANIEGNSKNLGSTLEGQIIDAADVVEDADMSYGTILSRAICDEGSKAVEAGKNPMDLRRGINKAVEAVVEHLKREAKMITTSKEIAQVATISANGNSEIGDLIGRAMEIVGKDGAIVVADSSETLHIDLEAVHGMKLDNQGFVSPILVNNKKTQECELDNPLILIYDQKISDVDPIMPVLETAMKGGRSLLIVAEDVAGDALMTLFANKVSAGLQVCAIKAPTSRENKLPYLEDLAIFTSGKLISEELSLNLGEVKKDMLGTAKMVRVSKKETIILDGGGDTKIVEMRREEMRAAIRASIIDHEKEVLQERLSKLLGMCAILKVGGTSEAERSEKKALLTNALNGVKAAIDEGIVPGGGIALVYASRHLENLKSSNSDEKVGIQVIQDAIKAPAIAIAHKAGLEGERVVQKLLEQDNLNLGYDATTGKFVDIVEAGCVDSVKIISTDLMDAAREYVGFDLT